MYAKCTCSGRTRRSNLAGPPGYAFTLVELLVVTAIVSMLASLLLPALKNARNRAKSGVCRANMRQLGMGWMMYADDNRGWIPENYMEGTYWAGKPGSAYFYEGIQAWMVNDPWPNYLGNGGTGSGLSGIGQTWPYIQSKGAYFCPANPRSVDRSQAWDGLDPYDGFGVQGRRALTTYFYRNGMYPLESHPTTTVSFSMCTTPVRLGDARLQGRVMMTDYWYPFLDASGVPHQAPEWVPHGTMKSVSLLWTDGSASRWKLPDDITPVWGWFGGGAYSESAFDCASFYKQGPWWWVVADREAR
ncbi:type II secretion system protein [bacterium]|nr:type II secretion system protein [bacterium]